MPASRLRSSIPLYRRLSFTRPQNSPLAIYSLLTLSTLLILTILPPPPTFAQASTVPSSNKQQKSAPTAIPLLSSSSASSSEQHPHQSKNQQRKHSNSSKHRGAQCELFHPFRVLPSNARYQFGGAFPLHSTDCTTLEPQRVEELIAVQWALSHWNQRKEGGVRNTGSSTTADTDTAASPSSSPPPPRLGFFAGESCSRAKEAVAQMIRLLDAAGYHDPEECRAGGEAKLLAGTSGETSNNNRDEGEGEGDDEEKEGEHSAEQTAKLLAVMMVPRGDESIEALYGLLRPTSLPIGSYSADSTRALVAMAESKTPSVLLSSLSKSRKSTTSPTTSAFPPQLVISTAPTPFSYWRAAVELLHQFKSELVALVVERGDSQLTEKFADYLAASGIVVAEVLDYTDPSLDYRLRVESSAQVVVSTVRDSAALAKKIFGGGETSPSNKSIRHARKLWIHLDMAEESGGDSPWTHAALGDEVGAARQDNQGNDADADLQMVIIRADYRPVTEFTNYFSRVLVNNHASYTLLAEYLAHIHNCTPSAGSSSSKGGVGGESGVGGWIEQCVQESTKRRRERESQQAAMSSSNQQLEPLVKLVYTMALLAREIDANATTKAICARPSAQCRDAVEQLLLHEIDFTFGPSDPKDLYGERLHFHKSEAFEGVLEASGVRLAAWLLRHGTEEGKEGAPGGEAGGATNIAKLIPFKLMEMQTTGSAIDASDEVPAGGPSETSSTPTTAAIKWFPIPEQLFKLPTSVCPLWRPYCNDGCSSGSRSGGSVARQMLGEDSIFMLSTPRHYPLYLAAMFDFHTGPKCEARVDDSTSISLPLALAYAMHPTAVSINTTATIEEEAEELTTRPITKAVDLGALIMDTCSSQRTTLDFIVESEGGCYRFTQDERNITIPAGVTLAYLQAGGSSGGGGGDAVEGYLSSSTPPVPLLTAGPTANFPSSRSPSSSTFSTMPSHKAMVGVLLRMLRKMRWEYVGVVVEHEDPDSRLAYQHFLHQLGRIASAKPPNIRSPFCIAEVTAVPLSRPNQQQQSGSTANPRHHHHHFSSLHTPAANVTLLFTGAKRAAEYMAERLKSRMNAVDEMRRAGLPPAGNGNSDSATPMSPHHLYVLLGDAHDFHLHDATANLEFYSGSLSIQPRDRVPTSFRRWLGEVTPLTLADGWYWRLVEERWRCALSLKNLPLYGGRMCTGGETLSVAQLGRMTKAGYLLDALQQLFEATKLALRKICGATHEGSATAADHFPLLGEGICPEFYTSGGGREEVVRQLDELRAKLLLTRGEEFEVAEFQPTDHHGNFGYRLLANFTTRTQRFQWLDAVGYLPYVGGQPNRGHPPQPSQCRPPALCQCGVPLAAALHDPPVLVPISTTPTLEIDASREMEADDAVQRIEDAKNSKSPGHPQHAKQPQHPPKEQRGRGGEGGEKSTGTSDSSKQMEEFVKVMEMKIAPFDDSPGVDFLQAPFVFSPSALIDEDVWLGTESARMVRYTLYALSTLFTLLAVVTLLLVLVKMLFRIVKGNQSMGICLLVGILALYATTYAFIWQPTTVSSLFGLDIAENGWLLGWMCRWRVAAHALAHTLCFGVMIVKAVQLHNAEVVGGYATAATTSAVHFSSHQRSQYLLSYAMNYWLLYAFIVGVQVALCAKWLIEPLLTPLSRYVASPSNPQDAPSAVGSATTNPLLPTTLADASIGATGSTSSYSNTLYLRCSYSSSPTYFLAEAYSFFLLLLALALAALNRNIKRNYSEAKWLFAAALASAVVLSAWALGQWPQGVMLDAWGANGRHAWLMDYWTVGELYLVATILLLCLFGPKLYVLLRYEPVVVECSGAEAVVGSLQRVGRASTSNSSSGKNATGLKTKKANPMTMGNGMEEAVSDNLEGSLYEGNLASLDGLPSSSWSASPDPTTSTTASGSSPRTHAKVSSSRGSLGGDGGGSGGLSRRSISPATMRITSASMAAIKSSPSSTPRHRPPSASSSSGCGMTAGFSCNNVAASANCGSSGGGSSPIMGGSGGATSPQQVRYSGYCGRTTPTPMFQTVLVKKKLAPQGGSNNSHAVGLSGTLDGRRTNQSGGGDNNKERRHRRRSRSTDIYGGVEHITVSVDPLIIHAANMAAAAAAKTGHRSAAAPAMGVVHDKAQSGTGYGEDKEKNAK